jgi:predicted nucleotide-binding protein (sugar kinase/HSP70/actin superfamily)
MVKATGTGEIVIKFKHTAKDNKEDMLTKEEAEKNIKEYVEDFFKGTIDEFEVEVRNLEFEVEEE